MCQNQQIAIPSFLVKLTEILNSNLYAHIIRWDKSGEAISIVCIQALQEVVLPAYFRHSKFSSFVRQLNMYGFHKRKADKNTSAAFYNKNFTKSNIIFSAMSKKNKKQNHISDDRDKLPKLDNQGLLNQIQHEYSTQFDQNLQKVTKSMNQINYSQQIVMPEQFFNKDKNQEVNQLIQELAQKAQPLLNDLDWLKSRQLQLLLKSPRFQRVNFAVFSLLDLEQISPFADVPFLPMRSDKMELIL